MKFIWRDNRTASTKLKEKNSIRGPIPSDFKTYCIATVIKTAGYWCKTDRQINRIESKLEPQKYGQQIFDKEAKAIQWSKDNLFDS